MRQIPEAIICKILMFMWCFGRLQMHGHQSARTIQSMQSEKDSNRFVHANRIDLTCSTDFRLEGVQAPFRKLECIRRSKGKGDPEQTGSQHALPQSVWLHIWSHLQFFTDTGAHSSRSRQRLQRCLNSRFVFLISYACACALHSLTELLGLDRNVCLGVGYNWSFGAELGNTCSACFLPTSILKPRPNRTWHD